MDSVAIFRYANLVGNNKKVVLQTLHYVTLFKKEQSSAVCSQDYKARAFPLLCFVER